MDTDTSRFDGLLGTEEKLLWTGRPDPRRNLTPQDAFLIPFSLLWCGFAVFWLVGVTRDGAPIFFELFGSVFVLVGLYFVVGRFVVKAARKRRTVYGLTSRRALVAVGDSALRQVTVSAVAVSQHRSRDGRHLSVMFGNTPRGFGGASYGNTGMEVFSRGGPAVGFYDVSDVAGLESALRTVQR